MPGILGGIYGIWLREFKVFQREKSRVISSIATPLMGMFIVGGGIGGSINLGVSYQEFIFPGIVMMLALFSSVFFGLYIVWDRKIDVLKEVLVSPVPRTAIFFGKVLGGCTDVILQICVFLVIAIFFIPNMTVVLIVSALGIGFVVAIGMVSVGLTIGSFFESLEGFQVIISFLVFPLFFLSGALFPLEGQSVPGWLTTVSYFDPLTYAVDALRSIQAPKFAIFPLPLDLAVIVGFAVAMVAIGTLAFKRMK